MGECALLRRLLWLATCESCGKTGCGCKMTRGHHRCCDNPSLTCAEWSDEEESEGGY